MFTALLSVRPLAGSSQTPYINHLWTKPVSIRLNFPSRRVSSPPLLLRHPGFGTIKSAWGKHPMLDPSGCRYSDSVDYLTLSGCQKPKPDVIIPSATLSGKFTPRQNRFGGTGVAGPRLGLDRGENHLNLSAFLYEQRRPRPSGSAANG